MDLHTFNIYYVTIFVLFLFTCSSHSTPFTTLINNDGHCIMYNLCEGEDGDTPCVFKGPPQPLDKTVLKYGDPVALLKKICPDYVHDDDPHVCCSASELEYFYEQVMVVEQAGMGRCQSCMQNFQRILCPLYCSPLQSHFVQVVHSYTTEDDEGEVVAEVNYYVSKIFAEALYDSCKDVQYFIPGFNLMEFICGDWGKDCTAEHWTEFMGSNPNEGGYSSFKINYVLTSENVIHSENGRTFYPVNTTGLKCSESAGPGFEMCSCSDCQDSCSVIVYHCELLASSCGECLDLPENYTCGWCEKTNMCTLNEKCDEQWLDSRQICTKPKIISFYPKSGLSTRQTNITINGINFGREIRDISRVRLINEVKGVNIECTPLEEFFVKHSQIVCQLDTPDIGITDSALNGHFEVKVSHSFVTVSKEEYFFVNPNITGFEPVKGLKSGGTYLKIHGYNLDAGSRVEVHVGDLPCNITSRNFSTIHCITAPSPRTRSSLITIVFDGEDRTSSGLFFYVEDPYVHDVSSKTGTSYPIGTASGGNLISVRGENFDHVSNTYIYITIDDIEYPGECIMESDKHMQCSSPRLPQNLLNLCSVGGFVEFDYGFRMGDVLDVRNISSNKKFGKFRIYPDPFFMPFRETGKVKTLNSGHLLINGMYLDSAFIETDLTVEIGFENCPLTALSASQLVCKPPAVQPKAKNGDSARLPEVMVKVEGRYEFFIGYLKYNKKLEEE